MCWLGCVLRRFISNIRTGEISDSGEWCTWGTGCMRPLRGDLEGQRAAGRYWVRDLGEEMPELCEQQQMSLPHCPSPSPSPQAICPGNLNHSSGQWREVCCHLKLEMGSGLSHIGSATHELYDLDHVTHLLSVLQFPQVLLGMIAVAIHCIIIWEICIKHSKSV